MLRSLVISTVATGDPVTYQEARTYLRLSDDDEQALVTGLITVATISAEDFTRRRFMRQTLEARYDAFKTEFRMPRPPLQSVVKITYIAATGNTATLAASVYQVDTQSEPGRIKVAEGEAWPTVQANTFNTVTIQYNVGYATATTGLATKVPEGLKTAIKWHVSHLFENREPVVIGTIVSKLPLSLENLLWQYRVPEAV